VRISLVQEDGKTALHRKLELALKRVPLCIPWRKITEVVKAALANGNHGILSQQAGQRCLESR
jgi:hypothetical protein